MAEPAVLAPEETPVKAAAAPEPTQPAGEAEPAVPALNSSSINANVAAGPAPAAENAAPESGEGEPAAVATMAQAVESKAQVKERFASEIKSRKAAMLIVARQAARKAAAAADVAEYRRRGLARQAAQAAAGNPRVPPWSPWRVQRAVVVPSWRQNFLEGVLSLARAVRQSARDSLYLGILLAIVLLLAVSFVHGVERFNAKPCSRGYVLSPGDSPLLPGECIEGTVGVRRLGFLPGFSWKPRLSVGPGGDTILSRADGTEILLAEAAPAEKAPVSTLCRAERLLRGAAKMGTPVYGARSRLGRLLVGRERFCSVDATPSIATSMSLAKVLRKGGGILGFSKDGALEMVTASGDLVWSDAGGRGPNDAVALLKMSEKEIQEKNHEAKERRKKKLERDLELTAKRRKLEKGKKNGKENKEDSTNSPKKRKKGRRRIFRWDTRDMAASAEATDSANTATQGGPHGRNVVFSMLGWGRSSPNEAGGQSG